MKKLILFLFCICLTGQDATMGGFKDYETDEGIVSLSPYSNHRLPGLIADVFPIPPKPQRLEDGVIVFVKDKDGQLPDAYLVRLTYRREGKLYFKDQIIYARGFGGADIFVVGIVEPVNVQIAPIDQKEVEVQE